MKGLLYSVPTTRRSVQRSKTTTITTSSTGTINNNINNNNMASTQEEEDKLHPKAKYAVGLVPTDSSGSSSNKKDGSQVQQVLQSQKPKLDYQRTLSAVDDSDDNSEAGIGSSSNNKSNSYDDGTESLGQDIVDNASFPEEEVIFDQQKKEGSNANNDGEGEPKTKMNSKKRKKKNSKKKKKATNSNTEQNVATMTEDVVSKKPAGKLNGDGVKVDMSPLKPHTTGRVQDEKSSTAQSSPSSSSSPPPRMEKCTPLTHEDGEDSSSSSKSSNTPGRHDYGGRKLNVSRKLDFVDHATQTPVKTLQRKTTMTAAIPQTVRWIIIIACILLAVLASCVVRDPTLPHRTMEFVRNVPHASMYKEQLHSTQQELWNVLAAREQVSVDLESMTQRHSDYVRQAQITEAKYKTQIDKLTQQAKDETERLSGEVASIHERLVDSQHQLNVKSESLDRALLELEAEKKDRMAAEQGIEQLKSARQEEQERGEGDNADIILWKKRYEDLQNDHQQRFDEIVVIRRDHEVEVVEMKLAMQQLQEDLLKERTKQGSMNATSTLMTDEAKRHREEEEMRHRRNMEILDQSRQEQEEELTRQMGQKKVEMERRLLDEIERIRTQRIAELDDELTAGNQVRKQCEGMDDIASSSNETASAMTIGQQVDFAVRSLRVKAEQVQEQVVKSSTAMTEVPIQSSESILLKGGVFQPGEPVLPRNLPEKLKNTTSRLLEDSKDGAIQFGVMSVNAVNTTVTKVESFSRSMVKKTHEILVKVTAEQERLVTDDVVVEINNAMASVKLQSAESSLLLGAWKAGDPLVPKVVDRIFKNALTKSRRGIDLLQNAIGSSRSLVLPSLERTKAITSKGLRKISKSANSTSALLKKGLENSKRSLSSAANTSIVVLTENSRVIGTKVTHRLKDVKEHGLLKMKAATSSSKRLLMNGIEHSRVVRLNAGHRIKQMTAFSVEKLSRADIETRKVVNRAVRGSRRLGVEVQSRMRTGLEIGKRKITRGMEVTGGVWRDIKQKSIVVGQRIGSDFNEWKTRGVREWAKARESAMITFSLAFP